MYKTDRTLIFIFRSKFLILNSDWLTHLSGLWIFGTDLRIYPFCFLLPGSRCSLYVSTFKVMPKSVLDLRSIVKTGVSVEHKLETYLKHGRNINQARSKHTSNTVEHDQNISRARSKHTSRTVETCLQLGRTWSKDTDCPAVIRSQTEKFLPNTNICFKYVRPKLQTSIPKIG